MQYKSIFELENIKSSDDQIEPFRLFKPFELL